MPLSAANTLSLLLCLDMRLFEPLVVDDFFSDHELELIFCDFDICHKKEFFSNDKELMGANPEFLDVEKKGFFLSKAIDHGQAPHIMSSALCNKITNSKIFEFADLHFANKPVLACKKSSFLYNVYNNKDYYKKHRDWAVTSALFWFCREPQKFTGGDLHFDEINQTVEFKNNRVVIFPSQFYHEVSPVIMDENEETKNGRYCITMFMC